MNKWFFALCLGGLAMACTPKENGSKSESVDPSEFAYLHFSGKIDDETVHLNLLHDQDYDGNPWYSGYYYFESTQEPINLYATADSSGQNLLILNEMEMSDDPSIQFEGKIEGKVFSGEYTNAAGKKSSFKLEEIYPEGTLEFTAKRLERNEAAIKDKKDSPRGHFSFEYFIPKAGWLKDAFLQEMVGDSLAKIYQTAERAFEMEQQRFFKDYHEEVEGMLEDDQDESFLNYDADKTMEVLYNQNNLLSIAVMDYTYAGGAHGNYGSSCASFDLIKKKKISLEDLFKPGYEAKLTEALNNAAKKKFKTDNLSEELLVDKVELNDNFFITGKGICFDYVPYEIASYAAGELKLFVPFEELKEILK